MCDAPLFTYGQTLNSATGDRSPEIVVWDHKNCTGTADPATYLTATTNKFGITATAVSDVASIYVPQNIHEVKLSSAAGRYSTFQGPYENSNIALQNWQFDSDGSVSSTSISDDPITEIQVLELQSSNEFFVSACMGSEKRIGIARLSKYSPASEACDTFMQSYCSPGQKDPRCACIQGRAAQLVRHKQANLDIPVTCTVQACNDGTAYLLKVDTEVPCSVNLCRQSIQTSDGTQIQDNSTSTIYCSGHFFNQAGDLLGPDEGTGKPATTKPEPKQQIQEDRLATTVEFVPWYTWLILAASFLTISVIIFLYFGRRADRQADVYTLSAS
jgi:hypothetical protein